MYDNITEDEKDTLTALRNRLSTNVRLGFHPIKRLSPIIFYIAAQKVPGWKGNPHHPVTRTLHNLTYGSMPRLVFEPLPVDPASFPKLSAASSIEWLKQASVFKLNEWLVGPFSRYARLSVNGLSIHPTYAFELPRKDDDLMRLILNFSHPHDSSISFNDLQLDTKTRMPRFREICYVAWRSKAKYFFKADIAKGFKNIHVHPSRMRFQAALIDAFL